MYICIYHRIASHRIHRIGLAGSLSVCLSSHRIAYIASAWRYVCLSVCPTQFLRILACGDSR